MTSILEENGETFEGIKLLLCENPLPPIEEAIASAQAEVPRINDYTEPFSELLRWFIADFAPRNATGLADSLRECDIFIKPLNNPLLGPNLMRVTTSLPDDNRRIVQALRELL
jgi:histidinol-phosphate/aromatic aminotransferase/cobyric acid decarboxylase-like protein